MKTVKQITKVYQERKLVLETEEDVPVNQIKDGSFIRLNNEFEVRVSVQNTILTNTKIINRISFHTKQGKFPDDISLDVDLLRKQDSEEHDNFRISLYTVNFPLDPEALEDIETIRTLFLPVIMDQMSTAEFYKLYYEENKLFKDIETEREKILKKEARDKARAIASAQLQKERQKPRTERKRS